MVFPKYKSGEAMRETGLTNSMFHQISFPGCSTRREGKCRESLQPFSWTSRNIPKRREMPQCAGVLLEASRR
jgi:hypothetical protein